MKISSLASIIAATLSAGGAVAGYLLFKPSNLEAYLKWQGHKLASVNEDKLWESIYIENEGIFDNFFPNAKDNDKWKEIKKYCIDALKKSDYSAHIDKATKFCLDSVQTVKGQLIRKGKSVENMMKSLEQFKVATAIQGNKDFWVLLNVANEDFNSRVTAYQSWCEESLKAKPRSDLVENVDEFCRAKTYSNFEEKLKEDGYERLKSQEIAAKYTSLGVNNLASFTGSNLLEIIGGGSANWAPKFELSADKWQISEQKFKEVYEEYCKAGDKSKFDNDDYLDSYSNYRGICAKPVSKSS